jgi:hypothetical protein
MTVPRPLDTVGVCVGGIALGADSSWISASGVCVAKLTSRVPASGAQPLVMSIMIMVAKSNLRFIDGEPLLIWV